ncbi:unnamed protein product [Litomosoides sigmodontis]|uniref:Nuclear receptor domain-containing protein n=1 Tax=Litomosoides sigmodontis TaxID=42156 RepID=A0A3P6SSU2_LITSI|nr:unnamed protein product [Litomosoides sigmodontis]
MRVRVRVCICLLVARSTQHQKSNNEGRSACKSPATIAIMVGIETALKLDDLNCKPQIEYENCPVCGDRVSGYHYGLLTCESCKVRITLPYVFLRSALFHMKVAGVMQQYA